MAFPLCALALLLAGATGCGVTDEPSPVEVKIGTAYKYRLYTHCGAGETRFAGEFWDAVHEDADQANPLLVWDDPYQAGTMTRISEDSAVFEAEGAEKRYQLRPGAKSFRQTCA